MSAFLGLGLLALGAADLLRAGSSFSPAPLPEGYESLSAREKLDVLWDQRIVPSEYPELPPLRSLGLDTARASLRVSFDRVSDEMPEARVKGIHAFGAVAKVEWVGDPSSPYTGLYNGAPFGLARLSLAAPPGWLVAFTPGMAVKLLVSGHPSANLHVMYSVDGQGKDQNFFAHAFSNVIPPAEGFLLRILAGRFRRAVDDPTHLSVDHLAARDAGGLAVAGPRAPYQLVFEPASAAATRPDRDSAEDFRTKLQRIPANTTLYEVWAIDRPGATRMHVGSLVTRSRFVASRWGDEKLFFKHQE